MQHRYRGKTPPHGSYHFKTMNALYNPDARQSRKGKRVRNFKPSGPHKPLEAIPAIQIIRVPPPSSIGPQSDEINDNKVVSFPAEPVLTGRLNALASRISKISNRHSRQDEIRATIKLSQAGIKLLPDALRRAIMKEGKAAVHRGTMGTLLLSRDGSDTRSVSSQGSTNSYGNLSLTRLAKQVIVTREQFLGLMEEHYDLKPTQIRGFLKRYIGASLNSAETAGLHSILLRNRKRINFTPSLMGFPPGLAVQTEEIFTYCYDVTMLEQQAQRRMRQNAPPTPEHRIGTPTDSKPVKTYGQACSEWLVSPHADLLRREKLRKALRGSTDRDIVDDLSKIRSGSFDHASAIHIISSKIEDEQKLFASAQLGNFLAGHKREDVKDLQRDEIKELAKLALMGEKKHLAEARRLEALGLLDQAAQQSKKAEASKFLGVLAERQISSAIVLDNGLKNEDAKIKIRSMIEDKRAERIHNVRLKLRDLNRHRSALALVPDYRERRDREKLEKLIGTKTTLTVRTVNLQKKKQQLENDIHMLALEGPFPPSEGENIENENLISSIFTTHILIRATNNLVTTTLKHRIDILNRDEQASLDKEFSSMNDQLKIVAANILQRVGKRFIIRRRIIHEEEMLKDDQKMLAIIVIQGIWRIAVSKVRVKRAYQARDHALLEAASIKIQLLFRSRKARKQASALRNKFTSEEREIAAIRIQCMLRRRAARLRIQSVQEKREHELVLWAALRLQCKFRFLSARRNVEALKKYRRHLLLHGTALRLQARFRARKVRRRVNNIRDFRAMAATRIQAFVRGRLYHHGHVAERKEIIEAKQHSMRQVILMLRAQHYFRRFLRLNPRPVNMTILKGTNIGKQLRGGECFPFVYMTLTALVNSGPEREQVCLRKCSVLPSQHDPEWNETFLVPAMNRDMMAVFTVCSMSQAGGKPTFLGQGTMRLGARYRSWGDEIELKLNPIQVYPVLNGDKEIILETTKVPQNTPVS